MNINNVPLDCRKYMGNILDLGPLAVPVKVQLRTTNPTTSSSLGYLPRLPTLIPWPGPRKMLDMVTLVLTGAKRDAVITAAVADDRTGDLDPI
ncbi:hypothetical protein MRB53_005458 [Persea americana]|uniref:Uncharacterized protein n=1 Tax=Persea americana TaxID=3435 RepID=A0ACC2MDK5_PERAE|nr:hypothetical protein MRB53_005458 [Persea americana]